MVHINSFHFGGLDRQERGGWLARTMNRLAASDKCGTETRRRRLEIVALCNAARKLGIAAHPRVREEIWQNLPRAASSLGTGR
jgi:hypothetical protein